MHEPTASRLKSLAVQERPQERLEQYGPTKLTDTELLAMLLRSGTAKLDVISLSELLKHCNSSRSWNSPEELYEANWGTLHY